MLRRSIQKRFNTGATTSQNGSVAPSMRPPCVAGTHTSTPHPTISHAISAPTGGRTGRTPDSDDRWDRWCSEGDKLKGAMSMNHSRLFGGAMLRGSSLIV
jgi:hypothetical protein